MRLKLDKIEAAYGANIVLEGLSLDLASGQIGCLLGPSGCGKTTALRCVAGFEPLTAGEIQVGDTVFSSPVQHVPPEKRGIGMVFQDYALLPHLSVIKNIEFGLHAHPAADQRSRALEVLELIGLIRAKDAFPHQLSGGEQQRVALARALATGPGLLLMDEPFSNLDAELRARLSDEVRQIIKQLNITTLMVTHDQEEAFALADSVTVMRRGKGEQTGTPAQLYHDPQTRFVADFVGLGSFVPGVIQSSGRVSTLLGECMSNDDGLLPGTKVDVLFRPEDLVVGPSGTAQATVQHNTFRGSNQLLELRLAEDTRVLCMVSNRRDITEGATVGISCGATQVAVFATS